MIKLSVIISLIVLLYPLESIAGWNSGEWDFKPVIFSRGGLTMPTDLSKTAPQKDNKDDDPNDETNYAQSWNLGAYGEESNAISGALTEISMEITYKEDVKYVYGVDIKNNMRFYEYNRDDRDESKGFNERLNYVVFYKKNAQYWFGQRAYRGTGEFLTRGFPFDELNIFGGGVRLERVGPLNIELAYGQKQGNDLVDWNPAQNEIEGHDINIFVNKIEFPLSNGMLKTNFELHRNNAYYRDQRSMSYIAGIQFQRWGDVVMRGKLYNIFYINYSNGHIGEGSMSSVMDQTKESQRASKFVAKWGGDWKSARFGAYWNFEYSHHTGIAWPYNNSIEEDAKWVYTDLYFRPVFVINPNVTMGLDYAQRIIIEDSKMTNTDMAHAYNTGTTRLALMLAYNLKNRPFDAPNISLFVGRIIKDKSTKFFANERATREHNFIRVNYEISI